MLEISVKLSVNLRFENEKMHSSRIPMEMLGVDKNENKEHL